jgi:hypothetical protein
MPENKFEFGEGESEAPFSNTERILAQRDIVASIEGIDEEERRRLMVENSDPFRQLESDPEFRRLIRGGNFEEARARLEAFKGE